MDDQTKRAYIRIELERAHDDLRSARDLMANNHLRGAVQFHSRMERYLKEVGAIP